MSVASAKMPAALVSGIVCLMLGVGGGIFLAPFVDIGQKKEATGGEAPAADDGKAKTMPPTMPGGKAGGMPGAVLLNGHRVRSECPLHAFERVPQIANARGGRVVRIVREDFEEASIDDRLASRQRRAQVGVVHRDDSIVRREHEVQTRRGVEQPPVFGERQQVGRETM